jgi:uncharacterized protein YbdZ (MbtH family)
MNFDSSEDHRVVCNDEEQYSIWPLNRDLPFGWHASGPIGKAAECLAHIAEVWTDMRPLSLRRFMAEQADAAVSDAPDVEEPAEHLVDRLSEPQRIEIRAVESDGVAKLQASIARGFLLVCFPETRGGSEIVVALDSVACRLEGANFHESHGTVHLEGDLSLDRRLARCVVTLDLATLAGTGHLIPVRIN